MTSSFFAQIETACNEERTLLLQVPQLADGLRGDITVETYIAYLTEAYHHVRHTVPLLMSMGARLTDRQLWLQSAIAEYIEEEQGHEQWILNDIAAAGGDRAAAADSQPLLETRCLIAYNYDTINRGNPIGFFGMVYMLESTSIAIASQGAQTLQQSLQLPASAFTYLQSHGAVDEEHIVFYRKLVEKIDDAGDRQAIIDTARATFRLFANLFRALPHHRGYADAA